MHRDVFASDDYVFFNVDLLDFNIFLLSKAKIDRKERLVVGSGKDLLQNTMKHWRGNIFTQSNLKVEIKPSRYKREFSLHQKTILTKVSNQTKMSNIICQKVRFAIKTDLFAENSSHTKETRNCAN